VSLGSQVDSSPSASDSNVSNDERTGRHLWSHNILKVLLGYQGWVQELQSPFESGDRKCAARKISARRPEYMRSVIRDGYAHEHGSTRVAAMGVLADQIPSRNRGTKESGGAKPREGKSHWRLVVIHSIDPSVVVKRWTRRRERSNQRS
jgi:hypothetical protein